MRISCVVFFLTVSITCFSQIDPVGPGRAIMFDGDEDYINVGNIYDNLTLPLTISAWVFVDPSATPVNPIFVSQDNGPIYNGFWFCASSTNFFIEYGDGRGENSEEFRRGKTAPGNFIAGRWAHVSAVMISANNIELYINGFNVGGLYTGNTTLPMASAFPTDVAKIGYFYTNGSTLRFKGMIDEIRIWNRALTQGEIQNEMCKKISGTEPGLIGYWTFDEITGSTVVDKSPNGFDGQLMNAPTRVYSGAPLGDESVNQYTTTWTGNVVSMTEGIHTINVSNISGNPQGVHIYAVRNFPSQTEGLDVATLTPPYFGVFTAALDVNNTFDVSKDDEFCGFFERKDNSEAVWTDPGGAMINIVDRNEFIEGAVITDLGIDLGPDELICPFTPKTLSPLANPSGYEFLWQDGSTQSTFQVTDFGVYWVQVSNACQMDQDTIAFEKQEIPLSIDLGPDEFVCPLEPRILSPLDNPTGFEFTWQDSSKQSSFQVSDYGTYWVTVQNDCSIASDTITISKPEFLNFFIPNVITPNDDARNDFFIIDQQLVGSRLSVYNRWGRRIYESDNYQNDWDGRDLPGGIYFYFITNSCTENQKGYLSILR